ncbi:glycosyltransferase family 2 protein [Leptolyngbya sp. NIES-2104]|uniref:glycosyltransferase family 2 protein n=1 Tax=Leptolyngbya sp. NIES-2104 TaxID=1552121 RepID=UPI0006EC7D7E|nr:glycosyltransferase family 2 protein [Leptolyngbya sp. NIES-2104]GAP96220.1 UDP-glucose 4-epimerase [Leptolyngbya sp. NIES-2104]
MICNSLVSVIIPAYNAEAFIGQTLDSVLEQTYQDFEIIVVDDGSGDRTAEIVESYAQRDRRIRLIRQANSGVAAARNLAIEASNGEYISPIDADDIWYPEKLEKQVRCIEAADETVGLVYSWSVYLNEAGEIMGRYIADQDFTAAEGHVFNGLLYFNFLDNASTALFRRSCIDRVGGYNCNLRAQEAQGCEDWDIYIRIAEQYSVRVVPEYLIGYRQYVGSMATNAPVMAKSYEVMMSEVQQRNPNIPDRLCRWSKSTFYNYLIGKSYVSGDYRSMFVWVARCLSVDRVVLLRPGLYKVVLFAIVSFITRPFTLLVWKDQRDWLNFVQQFKRSRSTMTIDEINHLTTQQQPAIWRPYDRVLLWRWRQIMQMSEK